KHNATYQPLFLYVPYQAVHVFQKASASAPQHLIDMFDMYDNMSDARRTMAAMIYSLDESIGRIVDRLHSKGGSSNWPLKGDKTELFEGSIRVPAIIWSPLLRKSGYIYDNLIDVSDILPTVLEAIGDSNGLNGQSNIYGVSHWHSLSTGEGQVRRQITHNIDPVWNMSAIRWHDWKLVRSAKWVGDNYDSDLNYDRQTQPINVF
ncbi:unnamed protein product, partial [Oppiella nova]